MKDILKFFKYKGTGVNQFATENQTLWTLVKEIFRPSMKDERRLIFYSARMRGSGY